MFRPLGAVVFAGSVLAAALALPATVQARDGVMIATATASPMTEARAELTTPKVKRVRKASSQRLRRLASVTAPASYYPRCFLFFCSAGGRQYNPLMLGVAY
jgi:hypothetical protein